MTDSNKPSGGMDFESMSELELNVLLGVGVSGVNEILRVLGEREIDIAIATHVVAPSKYRTVSNPVPYDRSTEYKGSVPYHQIIAYTKL